VGELLRGLERKTIGQIKHLARSFLFCFCPAKFQSLGVLLFHGYLTIKNKRKKCKSLSSNPSIAKKLGKKGERKGGRRRRRKGKRGRRKINRKIKRKKIITL
jgi:hypothetical protein